MPEKKPFSPKEFKNIYSKATRLCVDLVIITPKGLILSLRSLPSYYGKWHLPGGTVLYRERIFDAVKRVAKEELNLKVSIEGLIGFIEYSEEKERGFGWTISMAILCRSEGKNIKLNGDASEAGFFKKLPGNLIKEQKIFLKSVYDRILKK